MQSANRQHLQSRIKASHTHCTEDSWETLFRQAIIQKGQRGAHSPPRARLNMAVTNTSAWASQCCFVFECHMWASGDGTMEEVDSCWPKYNHFSLSFFLFVLFWSLSQHVLSMSGTWLACLSQCGRKSRMAAWGEALIEKRLGKDTNPSWPQSKTTQNKTKKHQIQWRGKNNVKDQI